jgi:MFS family permease
MKQQKFSRNVILTGFTSFFTDISSEMVYPLLQAFIAMILSAQKVLLGPVLGIIEGVAESTASLLKVFSGYVSDKFRARKIPTIGGYALSAVAKLLLLVASFGWHFVLLSRFFDRVGKGIRTAPRDALISESSDAKARGKSFGFQRGMDFAGAALGVIICYFLVLEFLDPITGNLTNASSFLTIFAISIVPAFLGVVFLFFIREKHGDSVSTKIKPKPNLDIRKYDSNLKVFFLSQFIFTLGNSSNMFLMLRSMDLGYALSTVILMYFVFNVVSTVFSPLFGSLSDKIGRKKLLVTGYALYAVVYAAFGFITLQSGFLLWLFWPLYGIYYALTEGVEKALVSDLAPTESKATALGFYHTITGIGLLPASVIAGFLFSVSTSAPFVFGGALAFIAVAILAVFVKDKGTK